MKKLAIIGANEFQNPLILKAKSLGYETHVFAWKDGSIGERTADYFYPISIVEKEEILAKCQEIGICGICSIASDLATVTVNYVADKMGLKGNSIECNLKSTNKYEMRKALKEANVPTIGFAKVSEKDSIDDIILKIYDLQYPLIVKPTDRSGSRAITKLENFEGLEDAVKNAISNSFEKCAIIEEYIEGDEYSCEGISYNGKHKFLTITKKFTTGAPHFIETGHIEPSGLDEATVKKVYNELAKAVDALLITNSATHSEFKITPDGEVRVIEIGARMGGDCIGSDLVELSTGYDFVKMVIDVAVGNDPDFTKLHEEQTAQIKFIFNKKDLEEFYRFKQEHGDNLVRYEIEEDKIGEHKVIDSSSRYGFYIYIKN